jgi:FdhD protein
MPDRQPFSLMTASLVRPVRVLHVSGSTVDSRADVAATEEPLQVRVNDDAFAIIMRTPGADRELAAGFLLAERVVHGAADIEAIERDPLGTNTITVRVAAERARDLTARDAERRRVVMNSSCGLCGRATIESLRVEAPEIRAEWIVPASLIVALPAALRRGQAAFDETGGLHAAGLFDRTGALEIMAEDVGRHNAVDKVVGRMLLDGRVPLSDAILFVSGRTSYEIVQKAYIAGIPIVGAVSAPSSLAVELAEEASITLLGFVRGEAFNVYTHARRVSSHSS